MSGYVLDAGALIGIDRSDPRMMTLLKDAKAASEKVVVPVTVVIQAWRDGAKHAMLAAFSKHHGSTLCQSICPRTKRRGRCSLEPPLAMP